VEEKHIESFVKGVLSSKATIYRTVATSLVSDKKKTRKYTEQRNKNLILVLDYRKAEKYRYASRLFDVDCQEIQSTLQKKYLPFTALRNDNSTYSFASKL
jgi:hypothetical protein